MVHACGAALGGHSLPSERNREKMKQGGRESEREEVLGDEAKKYDQDILHEDVRPDVSFCNAASLKRICLAWN